MVVAGLGDKAAEPKELHGRIGPRQTFSQDIQCLPMMPGIGQSHCQVGGNLLVIGPGVMGNTQMIDSGLYLA
jgi:hypothetical protein